MQSTGAHRAETTRRTFALFKQDPGLAQTNMHGRDIASLTARTIAVESAQNPGQRTQALEQLYQSAKTLQTEEGAGLSAGEAAGLQARVIAVESAPTPEARAEALGHLYQTAANVTTQPGTGRHRGGSDIDNLAAWISEGQPAPGSPRPDQNTRGEAPKTGGQQQANLNQGQGFTK
jgi:hypothetical protein